MRSALGVLAFIVVVGSAQAQPVDREAVRAALAFHGLTCADVRKASWAKRRYWAVRYGIDAEKQRQVRVACGL